MSSIKKYQIFVSSTYTDLLDERQAAVEAILKAGHIPAGMELFTSSNESQWAIIKRWIDESDIYMLILGGRYGSIEAETGKSYTHLEYEYAQSINKPLFAVVINDDALRKKTYEQHEIDNPQKLSDFRQQVLNYLSAFFSDSKDIKLAVHESLGTLIQDNELVGWVRGSQQNEGLAIELVQLNEENRKLREENEELKRDRQIRLPKLTVKINDGQPLILKYEKNQSVFYKKRDPIVWSEIQEDLKEFLTYEEIEDYNQRLVEITEEKIQEFNEIQSLKNIFENEMRLLTFRVSNGGTLKANKVHITIKFPDFIYVEEKNRSNERLEIIQNLGEKALEVIPAPLWSPLSQANEKLKKKLLEEQNSFKNVYSLYGDIFDQKHQNLVSMVDPLTIITMSKIRNVHGDQDYLDSSQQIVFEMGDLLHTLGRSYNDYSIFAIKRGRGNILINLHCEEYAEGDVVEVPIIAE